MNISLWKFTLYNKYNNTYPVYFIFGPSIEDALLKVQKTADPHVIVSIEGLEGYVIK